MNGTLRATYNRLLPMLGPAPEPFDSVQRAEDLRKHWQPNPVRLILLAESHILTSTGDLARQLAPNRAYPAGLPLGFVRHVYCPGYGEDALLSSPREQGDAPNTGSWQFWNVLYSCLNRVTSNEDFAPLRKGQTNISQRLAYKLNLLGQLRAKGVWLLDASIAALYSPGGKSKPTQAKVDEICQASWDGHVRALCQASNPQGILCIGRGVEAGLRKELGKLGIPWGVVPQPTDWLTTQQRLDAFGAYYSVTINPASASNYR